MQTTLTSMDESLGRLPGGEASTGTRVQPRLSLHPTETNKFFKLKRPRKGHDAMGLNQGTPALRNDTTQALGHNPRDILVSKSGVATPSAPASSP